MDINEWGLNRTFPGVRNIPRKYKKSNFGKAAWHWLKRKCILSDFNTTINHSVLTTYTLGHIISILGVDKSFMRMIQIKTFLYYLGCNAVWFRGCIVTL